MRPVVAFAVLAVVLAAGASAPLDPDFDVTFGIEAWRRPGVVACLASALAVLALLGNEGLARRAGDAVAAAVRAVPGPARVPILVAAAAAALLALPDVSLSGDAMDVVAQAATGRIQPSNALTSWLHRGTAVLGGNDALAAVRGVSWIAGLAAIQGAIRLGREAFDDGPRRAATAVLAATTGGAALWFGSVEVYAPLGAAVVWYLALGLRALRGRGTLAAPSFALGVAFVLHGAAGLLLPSLAWLAWQGGADGRARRLAGAAAAAAVPVAATLAALWFLVWGGTPPAPGPDRWGNFLGAGGDGPLLPLLPDEGARARYSFLDAEHALAALATLFVAAPAAWTLLAARGRGAAADPSVARFAAWALAPWVAFPFVWNVSYGLRRDWDLFSAAGFPAALLAAAALLLEPGSRSAAVRVAAVAAFAFVPFVVTHAGTREERRDFALAAAWVLRAAPDPRGPQSGDRAAARWDAEVRAHDPQGVVAAVEEASAAEASGDLARARALLDRALAAEPGNVFALQRRGLLGLREGRRDDAARDLAASLRTPRENLRFPARVGLARIALDAGDPDEAVRQLVRALREDSEHPESRAARDLLARAAARR